MTNLIDQPTSRTHRKVQASTLAAAVAAPMSYVIAASIVGYAPIWDTAAGFNALSTLIEALLTAAMTALATHSAGYWTRARSNEV